MSETVKNGGQAFPTGDHAHGGHDGMTLRDWFAGQALVGLISSHEEHFQGDTLDDTELEAWKSDVDRRWAEYCYRMADAMIAARSKGAA